MPTTTLAGAPATLARRDGGTDRGFALPEVFISIIVGSILATAIGMFIIVGLRTLDVTATRIDDSKDAQLVSAYLDADVQSHPEITTAVCGAAVGETRVIGFLKPGGAVTVYYSSHSTGGGTIVRRVCAAAGGTVTSTQSLVRDLGWADPTVSCDGGSCTAGAKPDKVLLNLTTMDGYVINLAGTRRTFTDTATAVIETYPAYGRTLTLLAQGTSTLELGSGANLTVNGDVTVNSSSTTWCKCPDVATLTVPDEYGIYLEPTADPLASLPAPDVTGLPVYTDGMYHGPGVYRTKLLKIDTAVTMAPGTYIIEFGFSVSGSAARATGDGVFLFMGCALNAPGTCSPGASNFILNGGGAVSLSAPTTGPYAGIVYYQARTNPATVGITAGGAMVNELDGVVYAPNAGMVDLGTGTGASLLMEALITQSIKVSSGTYTIGPIP